MRNSEFWDRGGDVILGLSAEVCLRVCHVVFRFKALLSSKPANDSPCIEIGYVKYPIFHVSPTVAGVRGTRNRWSLPPYPGSPANQ